MKHILQHVGLRKFILTTAVIASSFSACILGTGTAAAATPASEFSFCIDSWHGYKSAVVIGTNQYGQKNVVSNHFAIDSSSCGYLWNWWWMNGTTIQLNLYDAYGNYIESRYTPLPDNGCSTDNCFYYYS